jgi:polyhydroxyalkanoate synthase
MNMKIADMHSLPPPSASAPLVPNPLACYLSADGVDQNPLDMRLHSSIAKMTGGISPIGMTLAYLDWFLHLAAAPGKQAALWAETAQAALTAKPLIAAGEDAAAKSGDTRFTDAAWANWPFNLFAQSFVQTQQFWEKATTGVRGVEPHHAHIVNFAARQWLDMFSPSNFGATNPEVWRAARESKGQSVLSGWNHLLEDLARMQATARGAPAAPVDNPYTVGVNVALTPGKVVYKNDLVELIQYTPQTADVYREPVLIVPSWIMKYYILDLSPHNSMVRYLVEQGHTVFIISWRNPDAKDRDLGMGDYLARGLFDVLDQVALRCEAAPVHTVGYCLGGTLLAIAAAAIDGGVHACAAPLKSVSLLAAQTDFADPGELGLFIDHSELAMLDAMMWRKGYLEGSQMAGSFELLNSRDLIWSRNMRQYLLGKRSIPNDLMAWNADATRLPYRMHSQYLTSLFLHNDLSEGRYCVDGKAISVSNIRAPLFVLGTERDHVSPWRSVYKIHLLADAEIDFVLASGGHNAGIVSEPGHARRSYRSAAHRPANSAYLNADEWLHTAHSTEGSWWPHWQQWLSAHSSSKRIAPPVLDAAGTLDDAPGQYVRGT